jgi:dienelactone hydrolase
MKWWMTLALVLAAGVAAAAPPGEGAVVVPGLVEKAQALLDALAAGKFEAAGKDFDEAMKKALPPDKLEVTWKRLGGQLGAFKKPGPARVTKTGKYDVVVIPCEFEKVTLDARVAFSADKRVSGLGFVPHQTTEYQAPAYVRRDAFKDTEVRVGSGEWSLPGTLTLPEGPGPFPAVVLVHGSGPNDRDETVLACKPFRDLAWGLASQGIAVLRYEKRTLAYGSKVATDRSFTVKEETVDDALEAVKRLRRHKAIEGKRVFVLGHSLGAMMAPRVGAGDPELAGLVIMAGAARPLPEIILEQTQYLLGLSGPLTDEDKAKVKALEADVARAMDPKLSADSGGKILGTYPAYWLALRACKPQEEAARLKLPMLVLQGARDYQVTMADFALWRKALAGHPNATLKSYPKMNHLFIEGEGKCTPEEYGKAGHVAREVIDEVAAWIKQH